MVVVRMIDLLGDPVRVGMVRQLAGGGELTLLQLAEAVGVHVNTARPHVQALEEAGLLRSEARATGGPGRPAVAYSLSEGWTISATDFRGLAELLATALTRTEAGQADLRSLGEEWGRYLLGRPGTRDVDVELPRALERIGFSVEVGEDIELVGCPCPLVAPDRPQLICELAVGVCDGVLAGAGRERRVGRRDHDPGRRQCRLGLEPRLP